MTNTSTLATRRPHTSGKDHAMYSAEIQLAVVRERQERWRAEREADRLASAASSGSIGARSVRSRVGESLIRLGRRVAGESAATPAWTD